MAATEVKTEPSPAQLRQEELRKYWAGDLARRVYLVRRQRKAVLENCRRIAVVGVSSNPDDPTFVATEKLLGMGLELIPICPGRVSLLGLRCYSRLTEIPSQVNI